MSHAAGSAENIQQVKAGAESAIRGFYNGAGGAIATHKPVADKPDSAGGEHGDCG